MGVPEPNYASMIKLLDEEIDWSGGSGEEVMWHFFNDHEAYNPDENPDAPEVPKEVLDKWFKNWAEEQIRDVVHEIDYHFDDDKIKIWRVITAKTNWDPLKQPLGVFWSFEENAAEAHWGKFDKGHVKWKIESEATADQIDWESTIVKNCNPSLSDEKEIQLKDGVKIPIISLTREEKERGLWIEIPVGVYHERLIAANPDKVTSYLDIGHGIGGVLWIWKNGTLHTHKTNHRTTDHDRIWPDGHKTSWFGRFDPESGYISVHPPANKSYTFKSPPEELEEALVSEFDSTLLYSAYGV